jgi:AraC-like DNA-binding protein
MQTASSWVSLPYSPCASGPWDRSTPRSPSQLISGGLGAWRIGKIQIYIEEQLRHCPTNASMAAHLGLSAAHFCRAFQKSIGASPHRYLMSRRLARAHHLLGATNLPLADIAAECGMADQAHLTKLFRRCFGMPPGAWRRNNTVYRPSPVTSNESDEGTRCDSPNRKALTPSPFGRLKGPSSVQHHCFMSSDL